MCVCIQMKLPYTGDYDFPKNSIMSNKKPSIYFFEILVSCVTETTKTFNLLSLLLLSTRTCCKVYAEGIIHYGHKAWRNEVDSDWEVSFLLARCHSNRMCYVGYWQRKTINSLNYVILMSNNNNRPEKICP